MTRYLLDTNVISNVAKRVPNERLTAWLAEQVDSDLFVASMTVAEIQRGIMILPLGRRREHLERWFAGPNGLLTLFVDRILPFDGEAAQVWARLMADGRLKGRPRNPLDMIVAATAEVHGCIVATDNERDFAGLSVFNPLSR